ncbi:glycoside hydrolase family 97 protein [Planctomycetota bacterium]
MNLLGSDQKTGYALMPIIAFLLVSACALGKKEITEVALNSPDEKIRISFELYQNSAKEILPVYEIAFNEEPVVVRSQLGFEFQNSGLLQKNLRITQVDYDDVDETYSVVNGKTKTARNHYREACISLQEMAASGRRIEVIFRAFNDGVAFRYNLPEQAGLNDFVITSELSDFTFQGDPTAYYLAFDKYENSHEGSYQTKRLSEIPSEGEAMFIDLPVLLNVGEKRWVGITEASLLDYAGMYLKKRKDSQILQSDLSPSLNDSVIKVKGSTPHASPWRVVMIGDRPGALIESNLIINLNEPCKIVDTSWIKPGKTTWHWWNGTVAENVDFDPGMNTATMKHYIDFCAESGIDYHALVDQGGQGWSGSSRGAVEDNDITTAIPSIDMPALLQYAKDKGVGMRLWTHWKPLVNQIDKAFPIYEEWGIKGIMVDFMDRSDQDMVNICTSILKKAAKHHIKIQFHGAYKPTGIRRTYPNLTNKEGVLNLEYLKWSGLCTPEHNLMVPFTRMLAGPLDYHLGGFRAIAKDQFPNNHISEKNNIAPRVLGTRCHHLAMYVVYENPVSMVCDYPTAYKNQPGFSFIQQVPTIWDETKVINAQVGDYITVARRNKDDWYVGTMTDWIARELKIPLGFLSAGDYTAELYADAADAETNPNNLLKERYGVRATDVIVTRLASGGGQVMKLSPTVSYENLRRYPGH